MSPVVLDWSSIRPLNGGRDKGFEELCAQLARAECPKASVFVRKAPPDAGVECYSVLPDSSEWAWQAKYLDTLGDSQWSQIDGSISTALAKHPKLSRYFVCVPLDRPDARSESRKSAKERWDDHVAKWQGWAADRGMTVAFIYWGSHELLDLLTRKEHRGRVHFWFGIEAFDDAWFAARLEESLRTAGPRYTPALHIELPIALEFEAFGRTGAFISREKKQARELRKRLSAVLNPKAPVDSVVGAAMNKISSKVQVVLEGLAALDAQPIGTLPFKSLAKQASVAAQAVGEMEHLLQERQREPTKPLDVSNTRAPEPANSGTAFRDREYELHRLSSPLRAICESANQADASAGSNLMLLRGVAGVGKTHLLCDVARQRLDAKRPTVLLMGQRFISQDAPWTQALQQLDLPALSAEEFIGALEAAAQAANARALVMIDALNEGAGRAIWPTHLNAFLAPLERSEWVGVVLAVRSSYEDVVVPEEVRARARQVTHEGFTEHEYDAAKAFFLYYQLELPSTPLLAPEFRNPLFLKTLCRGLHDKGERRLPRGMQGITAVFDLYFDAVNKSLAARLDFDPRERLVRRALDAIVSLFAESDESWIALSKAKEAVDAFLPGRDFEHSLYRGLVTEGVLVEEVGTGFGSAQVEVVFVGYERMSDHLAARALLDRHLDVREPSRAFAVGGPLAFVCDDKRHARVGLLEALCIQVPERTSQELLEVAPACASIWGIGEAFRQSIVWRSHAAFTEATRKMLNELSGSVQEILDVLLTVATVPGHPMNALSLDRRLRKDTMADRDAWWSVYLHDARGNRGAVDRLVDWASAQSSTNAIDEDAVDLSALVLAWMFTSSNRFLRDRSTTALVSILTGRLPAAVRLFERFVEVDDPYVAERVCAVAYGVAMRSRDAAAVGSLAECIYKHVFSSGNPPAHILLRDYARGVIERALYLGSKIEVDAQRIRPPYKSEWPTIPSEEDIKPLLPDRSRGSHDSGELEWGQNRIGNSVMDDDFARYVIGTNSSTTLSHWLSIRLDEAPWKPSARSAEMLRTWLAELSPEERQAWDECEAAVRLRAAVAVPPSYELVFEEADDEMTGGSDPSTHEAPEQESNMPAGEDAALTKRVAETAAALDAVLTPEHAKQFKEIAASRQRERKSPYPPRVELNQIQRYILWRVFDLGWTTQRFGQFDRYSIGYNGRDASKAERIGKKYQWIAYHEIMAYVADRFQYREEIRDEGDQVYDGPWQEHLRDIDPSCTMASLPGGTGWDNHAIAWWAPCRYDEWNDSHPSREWVLNCDDLPRIEELLLASNPVDGVRWLNGYGYFNWRQEPPPDRESTDVDRRELWYICTAYLVRADDAEAFLNWAEAVDFWGQWMPKAASVYAMFLGEHAWAPASRYFDQPYHGDEGWTQPNHGCPVKVRNLSFDYLHEASGFDCSVDESYTLRLPVSDLVAGLGVRWSGRGADFLDAEGRVAAQDPTAHADGPSALLLREDLLRAFLAREKLALCWTVLGEKRVLSAGSGIGRQHAALRISGAFKLGDKGPQGFLKRCLEDPQGHEFTITHLDIVRTGD